MRTHSAKVFLQCAALTALLLTFLFFTYAQPKPAEGVLHYFVKAKLVINPAEGQKIENAVIEISSGKILRIGKASEIKIPAGAEIYDYSDKYIIPGLIDTHAHLYTYLIFGHSTNQALPNFFIASGVTSILAPGSGDPEGDIALKNRIDSGRAIGPRMFLAGEYIDMVPLHVPWMEAVHTPEEAKAKLDMWISRGASAVKLYASMRGDLMRYVINYAHQRGVKVSGHLEATSWGDAIEMGIDVLHHGIYAMHEIMPEGIPDQAIGMVNIAPPEFDKYYQAIVDADLKQTKIQEMLKAAAEKKVVFVPTVVALEPPDATLDHMSEQQQFYSPDAWKKVEGRFNAEKKKYAVLLTKKNIEFVREANKAGVMLSTGTDMTNLQMLPGFSLYREMELFREAGMTPMEILKAATYNGAWAIGRTDLIGSLEIGKAADFVILNANPLDNISNVRQVFRTVKNGSFYNPEEVLKPLKGKVH